MKKILLAAAVVFSAFVANAQTAEEIIAKNIEARGGAEKLAAVKSVKQEITISAMGMDIPTTTVIVVGKGMKQEIEVMGQKIINCIEGDKGWMINPMAGGSDPIDMPEEQLKGTSGQMDISNGFLTYKAKGSTAELVGKDKVKDKEVYKLKITKQDGKSSTIYMIDTQSYQILQIASSEMPEAGMKMSDYKAVDGVMFPFSMEGENPQAGTMQMSVKKIELNQPIADNFFKKPSN